MIRVERTTSDNEGFRLLIKYLDRDLLSRYEERQAVYDQYNIIENNSHVLVACHEDALVGCGCFKRFDDQSVEIKRMYVKPEYRGRGIASTILDSLEKWAAELNFRVSVLETGTKQIEAIQLYRKSGYIVIENYGPYKAMPESICMQKLLA